MYLQIRTMLEMQHSLENNIDPDWITKKYPYNRAAWMEAAEFLDWMGWKWWKKINPDLPQAKMELIDIWHFILAQTIAQGKQEFAEEHFPKLWALGIDKTTPTIPDQVEFFIEHCLRDDHIQVSLFFDLCHSVGLTWPELYSTYVGKNILNNFRTENGYKTGEYIKIWDGDGYEDNYYLEQVLPYMDVNDPDFTSLIINYLEERYAEVQAKAAS